MIADNLDAVTALSPLGTLVCLVAVLLGKRGDRITPAEEIAPFAADGLDVDLLLVVAINVLQRGFDDIGVEASGKALVAGDNDAQHALLFASLEERMTDLTGLGIVNFDAPPQ